MAFATVSELMSAVVSFTEPNVKLSMSALNILMFATVASVTCNFEAVTPVLSRYVTVAFGADISAVATMLPTVTNEAIMFPIVASKINADPADTFVASNVGMYAFSLVNPVDKFNVVALACVITAPVAVNDVSSALLIVIFVTLPFVPLNDPIVAFVARNCPVDTIVAFAVDTNIPPDTPRPPYNMRDPVFVFVDSVVSSTTTD